MVEKSKRSRIKLSTRQTIKPLKLVHLDISGRAYKYPAGFKYTVVLSDDYTIRSDVKFIRAKTELRNALIEYKARTEMELQEQDYKQSNIRLYRAGENRTAEIKNFCNNSRIKLKLSPSYSSQSYIEIESLIQEHQMRARISFFMLNLPNSLQLQTIRHRNWSKSRLPCSRINGKITIIQWPSNIQVEFKSPLEFAIPIFSLTNARLYEAKRFSQEQSMDILSA